MANGRSDLYRDLRGCCFNPTRSLLDLLRAKSPEATGLASPLIKAVELIETNKGAKDGY